MAGPDQTYWILEEQQLDVMISPRAHDVVDRLAADGPMSIKELAQQIGCQPSSLYHHISKLLRVGLVIESGSRVVRRRRELLYNTPARRMRLSRALADWTYPDKLNDIAASLIRQMARDFGDGANHDAKSAEGEGRNFGFGRLIGRPTPAQLARLNACLHEIGEILWNSSSQDEPAVCLGWVIAPMD